MNRAAGHWLEHSLIVVAMATLLAGCADEAPMGPGGRPTGPARVASQAAARQIFAPATLQSRTTGGDSRNDRAVDLGTCDSLRVPAGSKLAFHAYAKGVQIYRWNGTGWTFVEPSVTLSSDAQGKSIVGTHYSGPTWQSVSGSKVVGVALKRCVPNSSAIPWLLLGAVSNDAPGVFQRVKFIQRVNTVGGNAPSVAGTFSGELASAPYTAEYFFYREE